MIQVHTVTQFLEALAPPALAESWDNVGLLVGDPAAPAERVRWIELLRPAGAGLIAASERAAADNDRPVNERGIAADIVNGFRNRPPG